MAYDISFNGIRTSQKGVAVTTRPAIPTPQERAEYVVVAGRNGSLKVSDGTYEDITIAIQLNFVRSPKWWHETAREVRSWLNGSGVLRLENLYGYHYRVKSIDLSDMENISKMGGRFTAQFLCEPFQYRDGGDTFLTIEECIVNSGHYCEPCYRLEGSGEHTLTVNNKEWNVNITGTHIIIDTERRLVYNDAKLNLRTYTRGEYSDLFLKSGVNTIETDANLTIRPNWRSI